MMNRRELLVTSSLCALFAGLESKGLKAAVDGLEFGPSNPFAFGELKARAKELAAAPYEEPVIRHPEILETIDYDAFQKIVFRKDLGLGEGEDVNFPVQLFHLGRFFKAPVKLHVLEEGQASEILYRPAYFEFGDTGLDSKLPDDLGFSGFRLQDGHNAKTDWLAYLGGSYFRSSGELDQYGLSARGVAIDTALSTPEEFPRFSEFWFESGQPESNSFTIYALLEGPSLTGAFEMIWTKNEQVLVDVHANFYMRNAVERLGIAPLTSMFWFSEHNRHLARDWRPEIHDSDGLAMWTGAGERLWRPLNNPPSVATNSFADSSPKGFGLLQRDRAFHNYEDDGVFYERRPSVWIEPTSDWGEGVVQLIEIPTDDEIHDNIVSYWLPAQPIEAGAELVFDYRMYWVDEEPFVPDAVARVTHTRLGNAGVPGQPRPEGGRKFVIDFEGGPLESVEKLDEVVVVISTSNGRVDNDYALQIVGTKHWRAFFDLYVDGNEPTNLRCFLKLGDKTLTETWLYQYLPFDYA